MRRADLLIIPYRIPRSSTRPPVESCGLCGFWRGVWTVPPKAAAVRHTARWGSWWGDPSCNGYPSPSECPHAWRPVRITVGDTVRWNAVRWNAVPCEAMKSRPAASLAVLLAASLLLAGCGGTKPDASPSSPATPAASPSTAAAPAPTASPKATPKTDPNIPAAARAHTPAGAEAFTRYFINRWNVAWTVPRSGILSPLCQTSALACTAFERTATRLSKEDHRYDGNPVTIKFIGVIDRTGRNQLGVLANLVQERRSEIDRSGKVLLTDKREDFQLHFQLLYTTRGWSVSSTKVMK
jgi:hypothetical protein